MLFFTGRKAASTIKAVNRMAILAQADPNLVKMREDLNMYKEESAKENLENVDITYQEGATAAKKTDDVSADGNEDLTSKLARASLDAKDKTVEAGADK
ncbi:hypothetical protein NLJ89_g11735 [Agrocybe chaxingu]|uniref:Uncharacterized protein n=1 Tax=Agrocybe chaxingu TaxID=84603 RepID=A0A9W8JPG9_9AGAR|nr:hypothetical protein NLJ89_g11735 [Agrocybe chaxingu]